MERQAKLYICMAMAKSSRLLRNWKKDLNSSKVMPWSWKKRAKRHRGKINLLIWDILTERAAINWHSIPFQRGSMSDMTSHKINKHNSYFIPKRICTQQTNAMMDTKKSTFWYMQRKSDTALMLVCWCMFCSLCSATLLTMIHATMKGMSHFTAQCHNCQPV